MAIAKRPRKKRSRVSKGAKSLTLNHQDQLREARERIKGRDMAAEGWAKTAEALNEAMNSLEHQSRRD